MNTSIKYCLKAIRYAYHKFHSPEHYLAPCSIEDGGNYIYETLSSGKPCMLARYGMTEMSCILNYLSINSKDRSIRGYVTGEYEEWWWNKNIMNQMAQWSGFFPPTEEKLSQFCDMMIEGSKYVDGLAVYNGIQKGVRRVEKFLPKDVHYFPIFSYDSFLLENPWTRILKGKKVLVIHPFSELIESQYANREALFENPNVLPQFDLIIIKAVQSLGGKANGYKDWFEALSWMENEMDECDYDIALIGCGAYGFPLAAHAKRTGHQALHIGGSLQLLFGIKGNRWEIPEHAIKAGLPPNGYIRFLNTPSWVRPNRYITEELVNADDKAAPYN